MNKQYEQDYGYYSMVLIDTWWNVNLENIVSLYVTNVVLIDTWWNVNDYQRLPYVTKQWF